MIELDPKSARRELLSDTFDGIRYKKEKHTETIVRNGSEFKKKVVIGNHNT